MAHLTSEELKDALLKGADILSIDKKVVTPDLLNLLKEFIHELRGQSSSEEAAIRAINNQPMVMRGIDIDTIFNVLEGIIAAEEKLLLPSASNGIILIDTLVKALTQIADRPLMLAIISRIL